MTEVQAPSSEPLFLKITAQERLDEPRKFRERMEEISTPITITEQETATAEFHFRRPVPLPLANDRFRIAVGRLRIEIGHDWHIRPFWRDFKEASSLDVVDRSGKVIQKGRSPTPLLLRDPKQTSCLTLSEERAKRVVDEFIESFASNK